MQFFGGGWLLTFYSAPDGFKFAQAMQEGFTFREVPVRIGPGGPTAGKSFHEGYELNWYAYRHDILLEPIYDYPPFSALTEPK